MFCPSCGTASQPGQKFCTDCGAAIGSGARPAEAIASPAWGMALPPPTVAPDPVTPVATPVTADPFEPTAALHVVEQTSPTGYEAGAAWDPGTTSAWPEQDEGTGEYEVVPMVQPFRITPLVGVAALAAVVAVAAAFVDFVSYDVTGDVTDSAKLKMNDLSSNHLVGTIIAALLLIGGAALGATGRRFGTGIAGGAGLALAGMLGMATGLGTGVLDANEVRYINFGDTYNFTLVSTQEIGFFLAIAAAVLGGVVFALALRENGPDGYPRIAPGIGIAGALGTVAVMIGPLIPQNGGAFADNFSQDIIPPATLYLRLLVLVLIGVGGLVGFLANRRWGLGVALGAISIGAWQTITAVSESGDLPFGIAGGNFRPKADSLYAPHVVTIIGVVVMVLAGVVGIIMAARPQE